MICSGSRHLAALGLVSGLMAAVYPLQAEPVRKLNGTIVGVVSDSAGRSRMGATVFLYNHFEKMVMKTLTNDKGAFGFDGLIPDTYTVRVSLPAFVPAVRQNILLQPGMRSFLAINLASVISSVELVYSAPSPPNLVSDDWKWVLRSSMSTRPVLRFGPVQEQKTTEVFGDMHGQVRVQAGDGSNSVFGNQPDLGTAFAVATSLFGSHQLQVSGNVGYASRGGIPATSFRTRLSLPVEAGSLAQNSAPQILVTVRQIPLLELYGRGPGGVASGMPQLRSLSTAFLDRVSVGDSIDFLYGAQLESVTFFDRLNVVSPFARMTIRLTDTEEMQIAYSGGAPPEELFRVQDSALENDVAADLGTVSAFPRVSLRDRHAHVQRMDNVEVSYRRRLGRYTRVNAAAFRENVANAALTVMGDTSALPASEILPDPFSRSSIFNIGSYERYGFLVSATHQLSSRWSVSLSGGNSGTLQSSGPRLDNPTAADMRSALHRIRRNWVSARVNGDIPILGTLFSAGYLHTDYSAALPAHRYLTQRVSPDLGLNIQLRQPLPSIGIASGRLEAVAEIRNALSQGYQTLDGGQGRRLILMPSPRTLRGGLAFIF